MIFTGNNPGTTSYTMTHATTTCSKTYSRNYVAEGVYTYTIRASDGTNTTDSAATTFTIDTPGGRAFTPEMIAELTGKNGDAGKFSGANLIWGGAAIVVILYVLSKKKGKG